MQNSSSRLFAGQTNRQTELDNNNIHCKNTIAKVQHASLWKNMTVNHPQH